MSYAFGDTIIGWGRTYRIMNRDNDIVIAVMGVTGSGKSSFISSLTNGKAAVGHSLESCELGPPAFRVLVISTFSSNN